MRREPWNIRTLGGERTELLALNTAAMRDALLESLPNELVADVRRLDDESLIRFAESVEVYVPTNSEIIAPCDSCVYPGPQVIRFVSDYETYETKTKREAIVAPGAQVSAGDVIVEGPKNLHMRLRVFGGEHVRDIFRAQLAEIFGVSREAHQALFVALHGYVHVLERGDTSLEPGETVSRDTFAEINEQAVSKGHIPAIARETLVPLTSLGRL